ncbi:sigma-70 family RNA polymerase sigma factor [Nevskia sp.]|uniref:RNA polymerase sigma factor n=1 Tax=Nevskia sp. TaxID=1929292 RepID=UPI0025CEF9BE|nr:sigma-70 family RNA polymerase sigma factor [Nevskia sp.]
MSAPIQVSAKAAVAERIAAIWRIESGRLIAALVRMVRDVGLAEDLAQDALLAALEQWPEGGVPDNPGAWLMTTAKHRAIDRLRRDILHRERAGSLAAEIETQLRDAQEQPDADAASGETVGDDLLRLIFIACHPVLSPEARVALTLRLLGGLSTDEIARAFLVPEPTIAQRIVRAKRTLGERQIAFELPDAEALAARLDSVLGVIYLIFNEGYAATAGADWLRPALCEEALRLGRILAGLAPRIAEVHGLLALMEIQASRLRARTSPEGEPILLPDQDRARWDRLLIGRGLAALATAEKLAERRSSYTLQAAIAACHARAATAAATDWPRIVGLYDELLGLMPSPVVALNRAVAVGMAEGPAAGLAEVDELVALASLAAYPWLPSVRGDLLARLGRHREAEAEFLRAATLTQNEREQRFLRKRAAKSAAS